MKSEKCGINGHLENIVDLSPFKGVPPSTDVSRTWATPVPFLFVNHTGIIPGLRPKKAIQPPLSDESKCFFWFPLIHRLEVAWCLVCPYIRLQVMGQQGDKHFLTREVTLCDNDQMITQLQHQRRSWPRNTWHISLVLLNKKKPLLKLKHPSVSLMLTTFLLRIHAVFWLPTLRLIKLTYNNNLYKLLLIPSQHSVCEVTFLRLCNEKVL